MTDDTPPLLQTAAEVRMAVFRLTRRLRGIRAAESISDAQLGALAALALHGRYTLSALAEHERVTAPTMSTIVAGLVDLGYVTRIPDEHDRRRVQVEITEAGVAIVDETVRRRDARLADLLDGLELDQNQLDALREAAAVLRRLAER